jgi:hypothetical protein
VWVSCVLCLREGCWNLVVFFSLFGDTKLTAVEW